jgi:predicted metal-dependent hydrolase
MDAQIRIRDRTLSYQLRRSPRRRTLAVAVDPQEGLVVYSPARMSVEGLQDFLLEKADWILSNTEKLESQRALAPAVAWESGGRMPLRGVLVELRIVPGAPSGHVTQEGDTLIVGTPPEDGLLPEHVRVRDIVVVWLRKQAAADL